MPIIANTTSSNTFNAVRAQLNSVTKRMNQFSINESAFYANTVTANVSLRISGTLVANSVAGTSGYYLRTSGTGVYWSPVAAAAVINVQTFTSSGTWTKPSGYSASSRVLVQCWGGGGSGSKNASVGAGGGGGGYNEGWLTLSQFGATETATIGAGGTAVTAAGAGNVGGTTTLGSLISAYGGGGAEASYWGGGGGGQISAGSGKVAGRPTLAVATYEQGYAGAPGGAGGVPPISSFWHGGGGGGYYGAGSDSVWGGSGGGGIRDSVPNSPGVSVWGGNGGAAVVASSGTAGTQPGGGGGATQTGTASGAGGAGKIIVTIFPA